MNTPRKPEIDRLRQILATGDDLQATEFAQKLTKRYPGSSLAWNAYGALLAKRQQHGGARTALERAALLEPGDPAIHNNLGNVLASCGLAEEADTAFRKAIQLRPAYAEAHFGLGATLAMRDLLPQAAQHYRIATQLNSQYTKAWIELGAALTNLGQLAEARKCLEVARILAPDFAEVHQYLGVLFTHCGQIGEAISCFRKCLDLEPGNLYYRSNLLFALQYQAPINAAEERQHALAFAAAASAAAQPYTKWNCPQPPKPLRIGLVSGDLRAHPVGYFLDSVFARLPVNRLELYAYSTHPLRDDLSERLQKHCTKWSLIAGMSDQQAAAHIHSDAPHILVDLAGHSAHNRLALFAWRPAPLQVSWLGYVATTGMPQIDYVLADPITVPEGGRACFVEDIWLLPKVRMCLSTPAQGLPVSRLPALDKGHVTFGCFNTVAKLNDSVLELWARVVNAVKGSRLRLMARQFSDESLRSNLMTRLHNAGLDPQRVDLLGPLPRVDYLAAYGDIDIALDPFPFTGGTTTAEALWMGVPVLSMAGKRLVERQGAGILTSAGLIEWIATDADDYVERALRLSADIGELSRVRAGLREIFLASPAGNASIFAADLTEAFEAMWLKTSLPADL